MANKNPEKEIYGPGSYDKMERLFNSVVGCDMPGGTVIFEQTFGSTALGYPGIGCCAMTTAKVIIFYNGNKDIAMVFLGLPIPAYTVKYPNRKFWEDVGLYNMLPAYDYWQDPTVYGGRIGGAPRGDNFAVEYVVSPHRKFQSPVFSSFDISRRRLSEEFFGVDTQEKFFAKCEELRKKYEEINKGHISPEIVMTIERKDNKDVRTAEC